METDAELYIRLAINEDLDQILEITAEAVEGMNKAGNFQWSKEYPTRSVFELDILKGELFVAENEDQIVGMAAINQNHTDAYDELQWVTSLQYFGVHRLAVSKSARGRNVALNLLKHAESVVKENGFSDLRIDTNFLNSKAQALFLKMGYVFVGQVYFSKTKSPFLCYEKII